MLAKAFEIRDRMTFIPALGVAMTPTGIHSRDQRAQQYLLRRCGYGVDGPPIILFTRLDGHGPAYSDPYKWTGPGCRTMKHAHQYITANWEKLKDGDVIDVEFILGETSEPKISERGRVT